MPSAAPWAATELARLPVEAHAIVSKPSSRARDTATETTRSLNECVGLAASFLTHTSRRPSRSASRSARISGVQPAGRPDARGQPPRGAGRAAGERQEVCVAPDVLRTALDAPAQLADVAAGTAVVVGDLQRAEAPLAHVQRLQRILRLALLALQMTDSHWGSLRSSSPCHGVAKSAKPATHLSGIGTFPL